MMSDWERLLTTMPQYVRASGPYRLSARRFAGRWHWCIQRCNKTVLVGQEYTLEQAQAKADSRLSELP